MYHIQIIFKYNNIKVVAASPLENFSQSQAAKLEIVIKPITGVKNSRNLKTK